VRFSATGFALLEIVPETISALIFEIQVTGVSLRSTKRVGFHPALGRELRQSGLLFLRARRDSGAQRPRED
jgi:hypothetical protein